MIARSKEGNHCVAIQMISRRRNTRPPVRMSKFEIIKIMIYHITFIISLSSSFAVFVCSE